MESITMIYTFGSDHTLPDGTAAWNRVVAVEAPDGTDHRALFMAWLGSNKFSSEYTEDEYRQTSMALESRVAYTITVEPACGQCEFAASACRCIPQDYWDEMPDFDEAPEWTI